MNNLQNGVVQVSNVVMNALFLIHQKKRDKHPLYNNDSNSLKINDSE